MYKLKSNTMMKVFGNTNLRWFEINNKLKIFGYKDKKDDINFKLAHKFKDIKKVIEGIDEAQKNCCEWKYGFSIEFEDRDMAATYFCETKEIMTNWLTSFKQILKATEEIPPISLKLLKWVAENFLSDKQLKINRKAELDKVKEKEREEKKALFLKLKEEERQQRLEYERQKQLELERQKKIENISEEEVKAVQGKRNKEREARIIALRKQLGIDDVVKNTDLYQGCIDIGSDIKDVEYGIKKNELADILDGSVSFSKSRIESTNEHFVNSLGLNDDIKDWNFYNQKGNRVANLDNLKNREITDKIQKDLEAKNNIKKKRTHSVAVENMFLRPNDEIDPEFSNQQVIKLIKKANEVSEKENATEKINENTNIINQSVNQSSNIRSPGKGNNNQKNNNKDIQINNILTLNNDNVLRLKIVEKSKIVSADENNKIIDNKYRVITSKHGANAYKVYWQEGRYHEEKIESGSFFHL